MMEDNLGFVMKLRGEKPILQHVDIIKNKTGSWMIIETTSDFEKFMYMDYDGRLRPVILDYVETVHRKGVLHWHRYKDGEHWEEANLPELKRGMRVDTKYSSKTKIYEYGDTIFIETLNGQLLTLGRSSVECLYCRDGKIIWKRRM